MATRNEQLSNTRLRLWGDSQSNLDLLMSQMSKLIEGNEPIAKCKLTILADSVDGTVAAAQGDIL